MEAARRLLGIALLWAAPACSFHTVNRADDTPGIDAPEVLPDASPCPDLSASCASPSTLRECRMVNQLPVDTPCPWGCLDGPPSHCGRLTPSSDALTAADLDPNLGLMDRAATSGNGVIDTTNGSITNLRLPGMGILNGIEFQVRTVGTRSIGVFRFGALALTGTWTVRGANAIAIVSLGDVTVQGRLDLTAVCAGTTPGPGGLAGGASHTGATGSGAGAGGGGNNATSGGGGGAYGDDGGDGGRPTGGHPKGGTAWGDAAIANLIGGGGGGGGGDTGGAGGGGGGAIQIASNGKVTFRADAGGQPFGLNAGGCGGARGGVDGGGGGGAGGTILIEALEVELSDANLAVNGGSGGGGNNVTNTGEGANGALGTGQATVGQGGPNGGDGGKGGAAGTRAGAQGQDANDAGGGGGGVGRIRINTHVTDGVTLKGTAAVSPTFEETGTTSTKSTAALH